MLKKIIVVVLFSFLVIFLLLFTFGFLDARAWRNDSVIDGKSALKMAYRDYLKNGYVTNYGNKSYQIWLSTNIATIAGTQYQCFVTVHEERFSDAGVLAMTTNEVFIWLTTNRPPKIVDRNYRPPFFPPWY